MQYNRISSRMAVAFVVSATWIALAIAQEPSKGLIASDEGGASGYQHGFERTRLVTGAEASLRRVEEHGYAKVVGTDGVFAVSQHNGLALGVPNGGGDKDKSAEPRSAEASVPYGMDPTKHNQQVVDYFVSAGIPQDQIGGFHATTYLSAGGPVSAGRPAPQKVDGYATVIERRIGRYPVIDSIAWARMNENGNVRSEWVYWPAIPARVLADAARLDELARGSEFVARLPAGAREGRVVIRHSSATTQGPFEVFASALAGCWFPASL
jgi:hypothetical protein